MAQRTAQSLVDFMLLSVDSVIYWPGAVYQSCSIRLLKTLAARYPEIYTDEAERACRDHIESGMRATTPASMLCAFLSQGEEKKDFAIFSANALYKYCTERGRIETLLETPGALLWRSGHVGVYIGEGKAADLSSRLQGLYIRSLEEGGWTGWGLLPEIEYTTHGPRKPPEVPNKYTPPIRSLAPGERSSKVKWLQNTLKTLGYIREPEEKVYLDGVYGSKTTEAIMRFQRDKRLSVTGRLDTETLVAIKTALGMRDA